MLIPQTDRMTLLEGTQKTVMKKFSFLTRSCLALSLAGIVLFAVAVAYIYLKLFCFATHCDLNLDSVLSGLWIGKLTEQEKVALTAYAKWNDPFYPVDHPKRLKRIQILYNYDITDEDFQFVAEFSNLEELYLKECPGITDRGMTVLEHLPRLKLLGLRSTNVTEASVPLIAKLENLETLWLSTPSDNWSRLPIAFTDRTLELLKDSNIKKLWITSPTSITDEGLRHITSMRKLEDISLRSEFVFTDTSLEILKDSNLKYLCIESPTNITDDGLRHILAMQKLEELRFKSDFITQAGTEKLLPFLPRSILCINICPSSIYEMEVKPKIIQTGRRKITLRLMENHKVP